MKYAVLLLVLPLFGQDVINLRKTTPAVTLCPNATPTAPQIAVYTGSLLPACYSLGMGLSVDNVNRLIFATPAPPGSSARGIREVFNLTTIPVTTKGDGTIHVGVQVSKTPIIAWPAWVRWANIDAGGTTTDWFLADYSPTTKVLDITLPRLPVAGDQISVSYATMDP